MLENAHF